MTSGKERIDSYLRDIIQEDRQHLYEFEVYTLLSLAGLPNPPRTCIVTDSVDIDESYLQRFAGDRLVLKIVSPGISHKTDVGGVSIIDKSVTSMQTGVKRMLDNVPASFVEWLGKKNLQPPEHLAGLSPAEMVAAVRQELKGVLLCEFIEADGSGFGYELLMGLRLSREFGPVITAGLGGVDTELLAAAMTPGQAAVSVSAITTSPERFLEIFKQTVAYRKAAGLTRTKLKVADDQAFLDVYTALRNLALFLGPDGDSEFVIHELEVNPFVYSRNSLVPLDGLCTFSRRQPPAESPPTEKIRELLHPRSMAVIGVSTKKMNMGRIILRNIKNNGFDPDRLYVIRPGVDTIDGIQCVDSVSELPEKVDVLVLAVDASQAPQIIEESAGSGKAASVIIIPGGLGEKSGTETIVAKMNKAIADSRLREDRGPIFVGGNCLGILSRPGNYDTLFVPDAKLPKNYDRDTDPLAFITQSGARMITVMSQNANLTPTFAISTGNQMDLGISDFLEYMLENEPDIKVLAVYVEGFRDLGGLKLIRTVRKLADANRDVIFYKAGRTAAGKSATSGHTASVAGDYTVCESLVKEAGAMVCDDFTEFNALIQMAVALNSKTIRGNRLAGISNAGYETVGIADNIEGETGFTLSQYTPDTRQKIHDILVDGRIDTLVDIRNPMDVTPMAVDTVHEGIIRAQLADPNVDCVLAATIPITPAQQTLPAGQFGKEDIAHSDSYPNRLIRIARETEKPMIVCIDSGEIYDPMVSLMETAGLIVFRTADLAIRILGKYIHARMRRNIRI